MKELLTEGTYDTRLYPSDWRFSAAIVGLVRYFRQMKIDYCQKDDCLEYNQADVYGEQAKENYLLFAEQFFRDEMHHKFVENLLAKEVLDEKQTKSLKEKLQANTVMKNVFKHCSGDDRSQMLTVLRENRLALIEKTFQNGKSFLYAKFCNSNCLFSEINKTCRLQGYYVDAGKKSKSLAYKRDFQSYVGQDCPEFDYLPFAFTKSRDALFINNNATIRQLLAANDLLSNKIESANDDPRRVLFYYVKHSATFLDYNVEVIGKKAGEDFFTTLFVRPQAIAIFKQMGDRYEMLCRPCYLSNVQTSLSEGSDYLPVERLVTDSIINQLHLDPLLEVLLRDDDPDSKRNNHRYLLDGLIEVNKMIYGGENMDRKLYQAKKTAGEVRAKLEANKLNSYKQKLISSLTFKDHERFCEVLLQLSAYTGVVFDFAYDLFDDFSAHKNVAYAFVNGLNIAANNKETSAEKEENVND